MIQVVCFKCNKELNEPGGLLLSPPDKSGRVYKKHLCITCYDQLFEPEPDTRLFHQRPNETDEGYCKRVWESKS